MVSFEAVVPFLWFLSQGTSLTYLKQGPQGVNGTTKGLVILLQVLGMLCQWTGP